MRGRQVAAEEAVLHGVEHQLVDVRLLAPVRHPEAYEQSTIANFCFGLALAAASVACAIRKPTVTMIPHFWPMKVLMFLA